MPRDLFAVPLEDPSARRSARLVPLSVAIHAVAAAAIVVVPLFAVGEPPPVADGRTVVMLAQRPLPRVELVPAPSRRAPSRPEVSSAPGPTRPPVNIATPRGIPDPVTEVDDGVPEWLPRGGGGVGIGDLPIGGGGGDAAAEGEGIEPAPAGPVPVGGRIVRPRKLRDVAPEYPVIARQARVEGVVVVDAVIGPDGYVRQVTVRRSDSKLLEDAALTAVRQWVYAPTRLNDVPVAIVMSVEVTFRLR